MSGERRKGLGEVMLRNVRLSYPALWKAKGFGDGSEGEPKFAAVALMDPEDKQGKVNIEKIEDAIDAVKKEKWPKGAPKLGPSKVCLKDSADLEEMKDGYDGMMYVSASDAKRPRVLDADGIDVREGDEGAPYAGCYVDMKIRVWAQDNKYGKRINASLVAVKFRDDGDAFGAAPFDPDEFNDDDDRSSRSSRRSRDDDGERDDRRSRRSSRDDDEGDDRRSSRRSRDDNDEGDERRSRRSSRDDEGDDRRSSRRGRDDDDGDERQNRRSSRDDDDDRSSRSSRRSRDDDGERDDRRSRRSSRDDDEGDDRRSSRRDLA